MLVGKSELKNGWNLAGIKLGNIWKTQFYRSFLIIILFLTNLLPVLSAINTPHNLISSIRLYDYSTSFLVIAFIFSIAFAYNYRTFNELYSVYPQTNTSSFLSMQILYYIFVFIIAIVALALYLLQYLILSLLSMRQENVVFAYKFNWEFVFVGFFVMIMYLMLIVAIVTFVYVVIMRFHLYTILVFGVLNIIAIINFTRLNEVFKKIFGFLISENSIGFFLVKALLVWAVLFGLSVAINKSIIHYGNYKRKLSFAIVVMVIAIVGWGIVAIVNYSFAYNVTVGNEKVERDNFEPEEIIVDASAIPLGSEITLRLWNVFPENNYGNIEYSRDYDVNQAMRLIHDHTKLSNFKGEKIIVGYKLPTNIINNVDLCAYMDPEVSAYLEGNTLHVKYEYTQNIKAIFLPTWSFMQQFDRYKGKNIHQESLGNSFSTGEGFVYIEVE